jgi:GMP synthase-like glutamine amidotransferase
MRLHYFQHVPFEDPAFLLTWAKRKGHSLSKTLLYAGEDPCAAPGHDLLVIMGGPANIYEHDKYPWLVREKEAVRTAIDANTYVLGICLGGQLIADVLGGKVTKTRHKEIGWMPLVQTAEASTLSPFDIFPTEYMAFHWHGDTFSVPPGAVLQSSSAACRNQGFLYKERIIGLQYHIEATDQSVGALIDNCSHELIEAPYIHTADRIRGDTRKFQEAAHSLMERMLDTWIGH